MPAAHQPRHRRPRSVDVVDAPASEPRAVGLLLAQQPLARGARARIVGEALLGEHLDHVGRHVGARRVDHLAEVAERQLAAERARVVDVERGEAAVLALHAEDPVDRAADRRLDARPGSRAAPSRPRRCRRCRDSCRSRTRTPSRSARGSGAAPPSRRARGPPGRAATRRRAASPDGRPRRRRRAGRPSRARCPTPATGTPRSGARRRRRPRRSRAPRSPSRASGDRASSPSGAARGSSRPTAAGCRPSSRRPPAGARSTLRTAHARARAADRSGASRRSAARGRARGSGRPSHAIPARPSRRDPCAARADRRAAAATAGRTRRPSAARSSAAPSSRSRRC